MSATGWLAALADRLERMPDGSVRWWFRDDDAGWADDRLWELAAVLGDSPFTLSVAAIPEALGSGAGRRLAALADAGRVLIHQHGRAHVNHEPTGRRCEFGLTRTATQQQEDLVAGRTLLQRAVDGRADGIFVPPWNRCSDATLALLADLGYSGLSRDRAPVAAHQPIPEVGVNVDWVRAWREGGTEAVGAALAAAVPAAVGGPPVGVMLHHAEMNADDWGALRALGAALDHPAVAPVSLSELIDRAATAASIR